MLLQSTAALATPRRLLRRVLIGRDTQLPRLLPLGAVVVVIELGDLVFLVLRLARSALLLCRSLFLVKNCLLREMHLSQDEVGAFQL
jgi:hypothetical protein